MVQIGNSEPVSVFNQLNQTLFPYVGLTDGASAIASTLPAVSALIGAEGGEFNTEIGLDLSGNVLGNAADVEVVPSVQAGSGAGSGSTIAANSAAGKAAEAQVDASLTSQGLDVQPQVTLANGSLTARADFVVSGIPGGSIQVPPGYVATDIYGNPITSVNLGPNGQAIIEVKTGNASLTTNQASVYPGVQNGTAVGVGQNAASASMAGSVSSSTPVIIFRKV